MTKEEYSDTIMRVQQLFPFDALPAHLVLHIHIYIYIHTYILIYTNIVLHMIYSYSCSSLSPTYNMIIGFKIAINQADKL